MTQARLPEYYEILQVSCAAEPETIHRVYRLLAQRFHPDNQVSGDVERFQRLSEAYTVLSDPAKRAQYDVVYHETRQSRWRTATEAVRSENDFEEEQLLRLTILEALYARCRLEPQAAGIFPRDLEDLLGRPREHLTFALWYLSQKGLAKTSDNSSLVITALGVDHLEQNYQRNLQTRRLRATNIDDREMESDRRVS